VPVSGTVGLLVLTAFLLLAVLRGLGISQGVALFEAFYRSGALVFGGGHVVLPLRREAFVTPGWVSNEIEIDSPASGFIIDRKAFPNMYVQPGTKLYSVADLIEDSFPSSSKVCAARE
jgi:Chromate transporter